MDKDFRRGVPELQEKKAGLPARSAGTTRGKGKASGTECRNYRRKRQGFRHGVPEQQEERQGFRHGVPELQLEISMPVCRKNSVIRPEGEHRLKRPGGEQGLDAQ